MRTPVFLLLASQLSCSAERPIVIGLAGPFSEARGSSMRLATELAVREINAAGGVRGRQLELRIHDDSSRADVAVRVARVLYADPRVSAVIGHLTSAATLAASPVYNGGRTPVPVISPSASAATVSDAGPYTFRVCPTDVLHGTRLAEFARRRLRAQTVALLYQNDEYGRGIRDTFLGSFTRMGGSVVTDDPYALDLPSFEPYLQRLRGRGGADVLLIGGTAAVARRILATLDTVRLALRVMGGDALSGLEAEPRAAGVLISAAYLPDMPEPRNARFVEAYRRAYPGQPLDHRGAAAYDIVHLLAQAMEAVGPDRRRIRDYLTGVGSATPAFDGVTGRIAFDENGDVPDKPVVIGVVREGRLTMATP